MTQQIIDVGNVANDGQGDTLREAFIKTNDNFTELYNASSVSVTGNISGGNISASGTLTTVSTIFTGLPPAATAGIGARAFIIDSNSTTFNAAAAGGGGNSVPVFSNGTIWLVG